MRKTVLAIASTLVLSSASFVGGALASEGGTPLPDVNFSFKGPFGTYDKAELQRGLLVFRQVCANCHGLKRVAFRNLSALGYNEDQIKAIASEYTYTDGPDDNGDMFERSGRPSDRFLSPFANDQAAMAANGGGLPPDLSLITKARHGGADYMYGLLTGYEDAPEGVTVLDGQFYNAYMTGNIIKMPPPLSDDVVEYQDGTEMTANQYARDVAAFLTWAAEPEMEHRKQMGVKVVLFLSFFALLMYAVKRQVWSKVHH